MQGLECFCPFCQPFFDFESNNLITNDKSTEVRKGDMNPY